MRLIDDWQNKHYRCWNCDTDKSVKYFHEFQAGNIGKYSVFLCNKCALLFMTDKEKKENKDEKL